MCETDGYTHHHRNNSQMIRNKTELNIYVYIQKDLEFDDGVNNGKEGNNHSWINQIIL